MDRLTATLGLVHLPLNEMGKLDSRLPVWLRSVLAAGVSGPLPLIHDLGVLLSDPNRLPTRPNWLPQEEESGPYLSFLIECRRSSVFQNAVAWGATDPLIGILIARLLIGYRPPDGPFPQTWVLPDELQGEAIWIDSELADRPTISSTLSNDLLTLVRSNLNNLALDEVRFLCLYGAPVGGTIDPRDIFDLFNLFGLPPHVLAAVTQSLNLIPRLTPKKKGGVQLYPTGGFAGLARKGSLDSLLLTELVYVDEYFLHRFHNQEALYYGRERPRDKRQQLVYLVMQSGIGLGPSCETLGKGLLLVLNQILQRRGYEVQVSFAGQTLSPPRQLTTPKDLYYALYYRDTAVAEPAVLLPELLKRLRGWREQYRSRQIIWILGTNFDWDGHLGHAHYYNELRAEAAQQAWFLEVDRPKPEEPLIEKSNGHHQPVPPAVACHFEHWEILSSELLLHQELPSPQLIMPLAEPWHQQRNEIERYPFEKGVHDVIHFTHDAQWKAWYKLSNLEENPDVDDYMRTLAPPEMIYIPPGEFLMGLGDIEADRIIAQLKGKTGYDWDEYIESSRTRSMIYLPGYYIDRTPVTNAQYRPFVEGDGYSNLTAPQFGKDGKSNRNDQPVAGVSWNQASAYARWAGKMLPSDAHWEKAAGWDPEKQQARRYPWGDLWDPNNCNTNRGRGNVITSVDAYSPAGNSWYGLSDLSGNLAEWTSSCWGKRGKKAKFANPYDPLDGREELDHNSTMYRVRKGAFGIHQSGIIDIAPRCGFRLAEAPNLKSSHMGFRCIIPHAFQVDSGS